jgi:hypothetical protein
MDFVKQEDESCKTCYKEIKEGEGFELNCGHRLHFDPCYK